MTTYRRTVFIHTNEDNGAVSFPVPIAKPLGSIGDAEDRIEGIDVENPDAGNAKEEKEESDGIVVAKPLSIRETKDSNEENYLEAPRTGNANDAKAEGDNTYTAFPEDL